MSRLLFFIAIAALVYLLIRSFRKNVSKHEAGRNEPGKDGVATDNMVRCAQCGVYLPKGESVQVDGLFFCSKDHRDTFRK